MLDFLVLKCLVPLVLLSVREQGLKVKTQGMRPKKE